MTKNEFGDLFLKHRASLIAIADGVLSRSRCTSITADDVVQDAALKTMRSMDGSQCAGQLVAILRIATRHVAIDAIRKRTPVQLGDWHEKIKAQEVTNGEANEGGRFDTTENCEDEKATPGETEAWAILEALSLQLHSGYGDVLMLDYCQFSAEDGAALLGLTVSGYKTRLYRARKAAQKIVGPSHLYASFHRNNKRILR